LPLAVFSLTIGSGAAGGHRHQLGWLTVPRKRCRGVVVGTFGTAYFHRQRQDR